MMTVNADTHDGGQSIAVCKRANRNRALGNGSFSFSLSVAILDKAEATRSGFFCLPRRKQTFLTS